MNFICRKHPAHLRVECFRFVPKRVLAVLSALMPLALGAGTADADPSVALDAAIGEAIDSVVCELADSLAVAPDMGLSARYTRLTEEDYREVAEWLGVEVAAIKAVVDIEAGKQHKGFWQPGRPLINFDLSMYRKFAPRRKVSLSKARKRCPEIFRRPDVKRHGSYQAAQHARLDAACAIDSVSAWQSTFWGMFQIGGFNWRKCGTSSIEEFVELMSRSERDQLELFASFIKNSGMVEDIKNRKWLRFALKYNGPKARSRGYHTRLVAAYKRHKKAED